MNLKYQAAVLLPVKNDAVLRQVNTNASGAVCNKAGC
jgi:hypothetical protein